MTASDFLKDKLSKQSLSLFGRYNGVNSIVQAWMDDQNNSRHRYLDIETNLPRARSILDMASGCGTFVFYGLLKKYDVYGVEPEWWKHEFVKLKAQEYGYPAKWLRRFCVGFGEDLPFGDNRFDCVSSYQTLEHVENPRKCLSEMVRVTKPGGGIHLRCPDYRSLYEPHYRLPWLPLFPRTWAKCYLNLLDKPTVGLNNLQYVTVPKIKLMLTREDVKQDKKLILIDLEKTRFQVSSIKRRIPFFPYLLFRGCQYLKNAFRREQSVNLFVHVGSNTDTINL